MKLHSFGDEFKAFVLDVFQSWMICRSWQSSNLKFGDFHMKFKFEIVKFKFELKLIGEPQNFKFYN